MRLKDSIWDDDAIEVKILDRMTGGIVEIEIQEQGELGKCIYLDADSAYKLGEHLVRLSRKIQPKDLTEVD